MRSYAYLDRRCVMVLDEHVDVMVLRRVLFQTTKALKKEIDD